ncbi:DUF2207 domain-containing protein [Ginsengibacter hankyongi]|uniref:DUF2207 domain-containing protein n=1 Tax=Ginsengibacter hankyongi TaxID=2607284 RepID=A0A5J5IDI2_9BACT|nr:DUF2207 domain-containing protein [Ginsengibacter hankyongi]KAA9036330.1 DUF2207 domain-containing protein [Ginsengibacter hankyongi]
MMKKLFVIILAFVCVGKIKAQEYFTIKQYDVHLKVNKDASLDIAEKINVHFTEPRHGIIRKIPYKYEVQPLPANAQKADRQLESGGYTRTFIENINVPGWNFDISTDGDYKSIKIGSADKFVEGDQQFIITYRILNAINFFKDHSELYFNVIGNQWETTISSVNFTIELYQPVPDTSDYFVATGSYGSKENKTVTKWEGNNIFSGRTTEPLNSNEGVTIGIGFPKDFLIKPDYRFRGIYWLLLPFLVFGGMFYIWKRWGQDEEITVQTEFYPPENISPSVSGYVIDEKLDRRDLTALVPYWGAGGYLKINELEESSLFGLLKHKEYEFIKVKELPANVLTFEKTLFDGIFASGDTVKLSDLKDVLYITMNKAKRQLEDEVDKDDFYVKYSRGLKAFFSLMGIVVFIFSIIKLVSDWQEKLWLGVGLIASGIIIFVFGLFMSKKTKKGTDLYKKLLGFREFIKSVEKDRLQEFLKQDPNYFDKVLPYAIVFDMADKWKDKLAGLDIPPPTWYSGAYAGHNFNMLMFMNSLDRSMNAMTNTFYSAPRSSGSSGGSFGGGGGFSGGGFGGGGGSSW